MQRAAASPLAWEVREAAHPLLGPIRFAVLRQPFTTAVGANTVFSNVYVSCERNARRIAIELTNEKAAADPGGLAPSATPRLACNGIDETRGNRPASEPLKAQWTVNEIGDAMARGLWPSQLRQCASIGISQDVRLPKGWTRESARIDLEITSYTRELDEVFATCGEPSVYGAATDAPTASSTPSPLPTHPAPRISAEDRPWKEARVAAKGHANVRASPSADAEVVATVAPGTPLKVQFAGGNWWRARSRSGPSFDGYIRRERLVIK